MRKIFLFLIIICSSSKSYSQRFSVEFVPGVGTYSMKGLKEINDLQMGYLSFNTKVTNNFPPYLFYKLSFIYRVDSIFSIGLTGIHSSTGSRVSIADFSGEYRFDQLVSVLGPGVTARVNYEFKKIRIEEFTNVYYSFSNLKIDDYLLLQGTESSRNYYYNAKTVQAEFGLNINYPIQKFRIGLSLGYLFDFKSYFVYKGNPNMKVARTDWNGFRIGIYTSYSFR